jgi:hypothetical protein
LSSSTSSSSGWNYTTTLLPSKQDEEAAKAKEEEEEAAKEAAAAAKEAAIVAAASQDNKQDEQHWHQQQQQQQQCLIDALAPSSMHALQLQQRRLMKCKRKRQADAMHSAGGSGSADSPRDTYVSFYNRVVAKLRKLCATRLVCLVVTKPAIFAGQVQAAEHYQHKEHLPHSWASFVTHRMVLTIDKQQPQQPMYDTNSKNSGSTEPPVMSGQIVFCRKPSARVLSSCNANLTTGRSAAAAAAAGIAAASAQLARELGVTQLSRAPNLTFRYCITPGGIKPII